MPDGEMVYQDFLNPGKQILQEIAQGGLSKNRLLAEWEKGSGQRWYVPGFI